MNTVARTGFTTFWQNGVTITKYVELRFDDGVCRRFDVVERMFNSSVETTWESVEEPEPVAMGW